MPALGVKRERTNLVGPHYIFFPIRRQVERRKQRDPDLPPCECPESCKSIGNFDASSAKSGSCASRTTASPAGNAAQSFCKVSRSAEHVIHAASQKRAPSRSIAVDWSSSTWMPTDRSAWVTYTGSVLKSWFPMIAHKPCGAVIWRRMLAHGSAANAAFASSPNSGTETKSPVSTIRSGWRRLTSGPVACNGCTEQ